MVKFKFSSMLIGLLLVSILVAPFGSALAASASSPTSASTSISDVKGHWAEKELVDWMDRGLVQGYQDGSFKPDRSISRAEFIALINRAFGYTNKADIHFSDVPATSWVYPEAAAAVKAGYITGYADGTLGAAKPIQRQEAAVILSRLLNLQVTDAAVPAGFLDADTIGSWSQAAVGAAVAGGLMQGYGDHTFKPAAAVTRAEAVVILDRAQKSQTVAYNAAGTYGPDTGVETINKNVVVHAAGVTLQNMVIHGDLLLAAGIGEGEAVLNGVTVTGRVTVQGGGVNSIHFNNSTLVDIIIDKQSGTGIVRIVAEGSTTVALVKVNSPATIQESNLTGAGFGNIELSASLPANSKVTLIGSFNTVNVSSQQIQVDVPEGTIIQSLILDAVIKVLGQGTIVLATVNTAGSTFEKPPEQTQTPSSTATPTPTPAAGSGGGGGGGVSTPTPAPTSSADEDIAAAIVALTGGAILGTNPALDEVTSALHLITNGERGTTIAWNADSAAIDAVTGAVVRPAFSVGDVSVTLSATVSKTGGTAVTKTFAITLLKQAETANEAIAAAKAALTAASILGEGDTQNAVAKNLTLGASGAHGTTISWSSDSAAVDASTGVLTRPVYNAADVTATLTATISKPGGTAVTKTFVITVLKLDANADESIAAAEAALTAEAILSGGDTLSAVTKNLTLSKFGMHATTIAWSSDNAAVDAVTGAVARPAFTAGDVSVTLTATISKMGGTAVTKTFAITVLKLAETADEAIAAAKTALTAASILGDGDTLGAVTKNLTLDTAGQHGTTIAWSSDSAVVDVATGTVTRPAFTLGDATVTLTATIMKSGGTAATKVFTVTVLKLAETADEAIAAAKTALTAASILGDGDTLGAVTKNLMLGTAGQDGTTIAWSSDSVVVDVATGIVTRPAYTVGDATVTLTATISKSGGTAATKTFTITVTKLEETADEAIAAAKAALTEASILSVGDALDAVKSDLTLDKIGAHGTTIAWSSNSAAIDANTGGVTRPNFTAGDTAVTLTATISKSGGTSATTTFMIMVVKLAATADEAIAATKAALTTESILGEGDTLTSVTKNLTLVTTGAQGTLITWHSNNAALDADTGVITRPAFTAGDAAVTLVATISKTGGTPVTQTFAIIVPKLAETADEAIAAAAAALTAESILGSNPALSEITDNLILSTTGAHGTTIDWSSNNQAIDAETGIVTLPLHAAGDVSVTLTASISKGDGTAQTRTFVVTVKKQGLPAVLVGSKDYYLWYNINGTTTTLYIQIDGLDDSHTYVKDISVWNADLAEYKTSAQMIALLESAESADGTHRKLSSVATVTDTGYRFQITTKSKNDSSMIRLYYNAGSWPTHIYGSTLTGFTNYQNTVDLAIIAAQAALTDAVIRGANSTLGDVTSALTLPATGEQGTAITWSSDNAAIDAMTGAVVRPAFAAGDTTVNLTATLRKAGGGDQTKLFTVTVRKLDQTTNEAIAAALTALTADTIRGANADLNAVTSILSLNTSGTAGTTIAWSSNSPAINANTGIVSRPSYNKGDTAVTLTATISKAGGTTLTKTFAVTVAKLNETSDDAIETAQAALTGDTILGDNDSLDVVETDLDLITTGAQNTTIVWKSDHVAVNAATGKVTRPGFLTGDLTVHLTATISKAGGTDATKTFTVTLKKLSETADDVAAAAADELQADTILQDNDSLTAVATALNLETTGIHGTTIVWHSDSPAVDADTGAVTRPNFAAGDAVVTLTASITFENSAVQTKTFTVIVKAVEPSSQEAIAADAAAITGDAIRQANASLAAVTTTLSLATEGAHGTTIVWSSNNAAVDAVTGAVSRAEFTAGNTALALTATVSKTGGTPVTVTLPVTVLSIEPNDDEAIAAVYAALNADTIRLTNTDLNTLRANLNLSTAGAYGTTIAWSSNSQAIDAATGIVTQPSHSAADVQVVLTAVITRADGSPQTKTFTVTVKRVGLSAVLTGNNDYYLSYNINNSTTTLYIQVDGTDASHTYAAVLEVWNGAEPYRTIAQMIDLLSNATATDGSNRRLSEVVEVTQTGYRLVLTTKSKSSASSLSVYYNSSWYNTAAYGSILTGFVKDQSAVGSD